MNWRRSPMVRVVFSLTMSLVPSTSRTCTLVVGCDSSRGSAARAAASLAAGSPAGAAAAPAVGPAPTTAGAGLKKRHTTSIRLNRRPRAADRAAESDQPPSVAAPAPAPAADGLKQYTGRHCGGRRRDPLKRPGGSSVGGP